MLDRHAAGPEAKDDPAAADVVQRRGHLGEERGMSERDRRDERSEADALGQCGERSEDLPGLEPRRAPFPGHKVIGYPERVEAELFDGGGSIAQRGPADVRSAELDTDVDAVVISSQPHARTVGLQSTRPRVDQGRITKGSENGIPTTSKSI